ncbi:MAG TPA: PIG-L deacetylase family protein [Gemmataceae bacterium]|nr:PIG-L deacetylase family protein [Gemmataceae bacterium]
MPKSVVVIAPHPDDEAIGCGGTICLHRGRGNHVYVVFLTSGELGLKELSPEEAWRVREAEAEEAGEVFDVTDLTFLRGPDWFLQDHVHRMAEALRPVLRRLGPDWLYVPHAGEWHPDHQAALAITQAALHSIGDLHPTLLGYEVWTPLADGEEVEDITAVMSRKLRAVRCYRSQLPQFRYDRAVRGLNLYRGALQGKCRYAEFFQAVPPVPTLMTAPAEEVAGGGS